MELSSILLILGFLTLAVMLIVSIVDSKEVKRLKETLNNLYMTVAEDRIELYKELKNTKALVEDLSLKVTLLAARCNHMEQCKDCEGDCEGVCKKEAVKPKEVIKSKRPRKPKQ